MKSLSIYINEAFVSEDEIKEFIYNNYILYDKKYNVDNAPVNAFDWQNNKPEYKDRNVDEFDKYITIHKNVVDVDASLELHSGVKNLTNKKFKFGTIEGGFSLFGCRNINNLSGGPKIVKGHYSCNELKKIKTLKDLAIYIGGGLDLTLCGNIVDFTSLPEGFKLDGDLYVSDMKKLETLKGLPEVINGNLYVTYNENLMNMGDIKEVKGTIYTKGTGYISSEIEKGTDTKDPIKCKKLDKTTRFD